MDISGKIRRKTLAQDVFDKRWSLGRVKTLIKNISARSLTLLMFAVGWALCGGAEPEHESMMPLLSLFPLNVYCLNPLQLYPLPGNIFGK